MMAIIGSYLDYTATALLSPGYHPRSLGFPSVYPLQCAPRGAHLTGKWILGLISWSSLDVTDHFQGYHIETRSR